MKVTTVSVTVAAAVFAALIAADANSQIIGACVNPGGQLSKVTVGAVPSCPGNKTPISWNMQGSPGEDGADGMDADGTSVAGKSCPAGLAVTGFGASGELICAAPWVIPPDGEPPNLDIACVINYDQNQAENDALTAANTAIDQAVADGVDPFSGSFALNALTVDYSFSVTTISPDAAMLSIVAPLAELLESQPCDDAIIADVVLPDTSVTGTWDIDVTVFGGTVSFTGDFMADVTGATLEVTVLLSSPDLSGVTMSTSFDRTVQSVALTGATTPTINIGFQGDSLVADVLNGLSSILQTTLNSSLVEVIRNTVETGLADVLSDLPAPVTVEVTVTP